MRSKVVAVVFAALALLVASTASGVAAPPEPHRFITRPDLSPPVVRIDTPANGTEPGSIFLAPHGTAAQSGPMIVDDAGQPVWFQPVGDGAGLFTMDFKAQTYRGQPVLTWWQGAPRPGYGEGEYVLLDRSYQQIATVRAGNDLRADLHEMIITPRDTALLIAYRTVQLDRPVVEGVVQEIDIATGEVLFDWRSLDHVALDESTVPLPEDPAAPYDYIHLNSVTEDANGNLLISARHTDAIYQLDRATGGVQWRLGGKRSDFALDPDAVFGRQHDARWHPDGTMSLFDNAASVPGPASRALVLAVDQTARTARVVREFTHPGGATSVSQGGHQVLAGGNSFVGWGSQPEFTEFDETGAVALHGSFGDNMPSYRAFRLPWTGTPTELPAAAMNADDGTPTVYASWNGATEARTWRVLAGPAPDQLAPVADVPKTGFETAADLPAAEDYAAVEALDANGQVLARSEVVKSE
ncbi:arylsulfotransferase family protein [Saccharopolyspora indica]|uniref:arylsulfotransferase family protein n=1 Tax=Saccharopolyspora indica TaxID=1229659 RepID=UPI0022EA1FF5|nr:arylsulfotransferase family protein [Saccharopolyspora indica]MDA3649157.1 arylsulfotransferase family protein [Saccharopolyspora indica]